MYTCEVVSKKVSVVCSVARNTFIAPISPLVSYAV